MLPEKPIGIRFSHLMPIALYMLFSPVSVPDFTTVGTHGLNAEFSLLALLGSFWLPPVRTVAAEIAAARSFSGFGVYHKFQWIL